MNLQEILDTIPGADPALYRQAAAHWNHLAKPLGSLGALETYVSRIAALTGTTDVRIDRRTLLVFCADNGVVAQGVSQSDATVTEAVARALGQGTSTVNHLAQGLNCPVVPVDVGMSSPETPPGVQDLRVCPGTADMTQRPVMSRTECLAAIETGFRLAEEAKANGTQLLLSGEMGIGNTTTSAAVLSVLLDVPPETITGRGAGLSDAGLARKINAIRQAIQVNFPDPADPIDVLRKVGGLDLAALCGLFLGGAYFRIPVFLDGLITAAAALCAVRLCPRARDALMASHLSAEPAAALALEALDLQPLLSAGMRLGEGSGAVAALPLLDMALRVYHSENTFAHLGIDPYQPW